MIRARRLRLPPRIKALEAAGALGDGRVTLWRGLDGSLRARVESSDGSRSYTVVVAGGPQGPIRAFSSDNGTRLRGYVGYPILAVLMLDGRLPRDRDVEEALRGVPWRRLNEQLKKYDLVIERVKEIAAERGLDPERLERYMEEVRQQLKRITIIYDPSLAEE